MLWFLAVEKELQLICKGQFSSRPAGYQSSYSQSGAVSESLEVTGEVTSQRDFQSWSHRPVDKALLMWAGSASLGRSGRQGTGASESPGSFSVLPVPTVHTPTSPSLPLRCWGLKQEHKRGLFTAGLNI